MRELQELLNSDDVEVRRAAVEGLREQSSEETIPILLKALTDKSWRLRKNATDILTSRYPKDLYIIGLLQLLYQEDNAGARISAIETFV